jgi:hypothetical protein
MGSAEAAMAVRDRIAPTSAGVPTDGIGNLMCSYLPEAVTQILAQVPGENKRTQGVKHPDSVHRFFHHEEYFQLTCAAPNFGVPPLSATCAAPT